MMERLTKRIPVPKEERKVVVFTQGKYSDTIPAEMTHDDIRKVLRKLAEYEDAEEQALLLRLPCKVGDTVWKVNKASKKITSHKVIKFEIEKSDKNGFTMQIWFDNYNFCFYSHFGKTVFLTQSEAEQKLKEMEDK